MPRNRMPFDDALDFTDGIGLPDGAAMEMAEEMAFDDYDDGYPGPCTSSEGHSWVVSDEDDRCYCEFCGADGDA